jgi:hypothetical protein
MKLPASAGVLAFASLSFLTVAIGQDDSSEQKHVSAPHAER